MVKQTQRININKRNEYIGNKFKIDIGMAKVTLDIHSDTSLTFTLIEQNGNALNISETVETKMVELKP